MNAIIFVDQLTHDIFLRMPILPVHKYPGFYKKFWFCKSASVDSCKSVLSELVYCQITEEITYKQDGKQKKH